MQARIDLGLQLFQLVTQVKGRVVATIGILCETAVDDTAHVARQRPVQLVEAAFDSSLLKRPRLLVATKLDACTGDGERLRGLQAAAEARGPRDDKAPNNLPLKLARFVGRERESEEIMSMLEQNRLVTLTGMFRF